MRYQASETFICLSKIIAQTILSSPIKNDDDTKNLNDNNYPSTTHNVKKSQQKYENFVILNENATDGNTEYVEVQVLENNDENDNDAVEDDEELHSVNDNSISYEITSLSTKSTDDNADCIDEIEDAVTFQYKNDLLLLEKLKKRRSQQKANLTASTTNTNKKTTTPTSTAAAITDINYDERKHFCNVCKKKFLRRSNLIDHLRLHAKVKLFQCTECDKSFVQAGNLKSHMRTHTKERPFVCQICERSYNQSSALKVHYRTHTNERNYCCDRCPKAFTNSSDLRKHERVHNPELMLKCEMCPKLFAQRGNLKNHMLSHHNVVMLLSKDK